MPYIKPNLKPQQFAVYAIGKMKNTTFAANHVDDEGTVDTAHPLIVSEYINAYIPITFFDGERSSYFSIYDENLQISENSQYSFSFSVAKYLNGELNPIFYLLVENRRLRLQTYYQKIDFVITSITPQITNQNIIYQVTCQDAFSYDMSKHNVSITYEPETPLNIRELGEAIIELGKVRGRWKIDSELESNYYADFPALQQVNAGVTRTPHKMKATLAINGSTIYNALIELAKKFNANLRVEYSDKEDEPGTIFFDNKLLNDFQGYILRPEVNMSAFSVSRKTDSFCSVMHVSGGEDADGNIVSMVPNIPADVQKYFIMMYPHYVRNADELSDVLSNSSHYYCVIENVDHTFSLYRKSGSVYVLSGPLPTKPWTQMTAEEIRDDFNSLRLENNKKFDSAQSNEVNDYFNFLAYRAKTGASLFYDFSYYRDVGLMDQQTYDDLEQLFAYRLRNANIILFCVTYQYNMLSAKLMDYEMREEEYFAQLAALEEELYLYRTGQLETPEKVLGVSGAYGDQAGTLTATTIEQVNANERMSILNLLYTNVWTEEYYKLLFTVKGSSALEDKITALQTGGWEKQLAKFRTNFSSAQTLLNTRVLPGYITFVKSTYPSGDYTEVQLTSSTPVAYYYGNSSFITTPTHARAYNTANGYQLFLIGDGGATILKVTYNNAVINTGKDPSSTSQGTWDTAQASNYGFLSVTSSGDGDMSHYKTINLQLYHSKVNEACVIDIFKPEACVSTLERENYLANEDTAIYSNYATYKKRYADALAFLEETPQTTDPRDARTTPRRRGLYKLQLDYWTDMLSQPNTDPYNYFAAKNKYSTPFNLLEWLNSARLEQGAIWEEIYNVYGDFIAETTFTDSDQISSEGLFMAAMQSFSKYNHPTYEYSATVINSSAIINLADKDIAIGDIVNVYNKDVSSQFANQIRVTLPRNKIGVFYGDGSDPEFTTLENLVDGTPYWTPTINTLEIANAKCRLFCGKAADSKYVYTYGEGVGEYVELATAELSADTWTNGAGTDLQILRAETHDNYVDLLIECSALQAAAILGSRASIDSITIYPMNGTPFSDGLTSRIVYSSVLDIQMEENVKPIPLQVTGVTKKLREATSQLTVSTDRTMDLVFHRLIQQARL